MMLSFGVERKSGLESFLKRTRVRTTHLPERRNGSGEVVPRIKTTFGLARPNDGYGLAHPPKVRVFGAGPRDVEFWLDSEGQHGSPPVDKNQRKEQKGPKMNKPGNSAIWEIHQRLRLLFE